MQALLENWPLWLQGMGATLLLTAVVTLIGLPIGILLAGMRVSPVAALRVVAAVWTEVARNTPLTLVFFFTAFVLPKLGIILDFTLGAVIALTYYTSAFFGEAVRSGINSVPIGQAEASRSIGPFSRLSSQPPLSSLSRSTMFSSYFFWYSAPMRSSCSLVRPLIVATTWSRSMPQPATPKRTCSATLSPPPF